MLGKYNGFVSKARVSACMYFLEFMILWLEFFCLKHERFRF